VSTDPWEKAYVYGQSHLRSEVAHLADGIYWPLCESAVLYKLNRTPKPYPVCRNCLRTKRAKELGLS
jgi:hypothetical protein